MLFKEIIAVYTDSEIYLHGERPATNDLSHGTA
jgi:hypothetical protein